MIQIFSKEFKEALRDALTNVKTKAEEIVSPETGAKIVKMYNQAKEVAGDAIDQAKDALDTAVAKKISAGDVTARTNAKKAQREAQRAAAKAVRDKISDEIKAIQSLPDVEEVYCQRSQTKPTFKSNPNMPVVTEIAKVTVIGVVKRLSNGRFRLQISLSRRNICDRYMKSQGYLIALKRAYDPKSTFEIEGHTFETIKIGDFDSPLQKDLFLSIAEELIYKYEFGQEIYTKPMRNAIEKNVEDLIEYVKDTVK